MERQSSEVKQRMVLIELVEKKPFLWDRNHPMYFSIAEKNACWESIAKQLRPHGLVAQGKDTKRMWKSLCDNYRRYIRNSTSNVGGNRVRWKYFNQMSFMRNNISFGTRFSNVRRDCTDNDPVGTKNVENDPDMEDDILGQVRQEVRNVENMASSASLEDYALPLESEGATPYSDVTLQSLLDSNIIKQEETFNNEEVNRESDSAAPNSDVTLQSLVDANRRRQPETFTNEEIIRAFDAVRSLSSDIIDKDEFDILGATIADAMRSLNSKMARKMKKEAYAMIARYMMENSDEETDT